MRYYFSVMILPILFLVNTNLVNAETQGDSSMGNDSFSNICAICHGTEGKGDGPAGAALDPKPRDLSDGTYVSTLTDEYLFTVIKEGGASQGKSAAMPPWGGSLSDEQIWNVVAHLRENVCKCQHSGN